MQAIDYLTFLKRNGSTANKLRNNAKPSPKEFPAGPARCRAVVEGEYPLGILNMPGKEFVVNDPAVEFPRYPREKVEVKDGKVVKRTPAPVEIQRGNEKFTSHFVDGWMEYLGTYQADGSFKEYHGELASGGAAGGGMLAGVAAAGAEVLGALTGTGSGQAGQGQDMKRP